MARKQPEEKFEYEDFLGWTVSSLKDFLGIRGLKQSGKKAELIARAFGAYELNAPKKFSQEEIYEKIKEEYSKRLQTHGIKSDPSGLPEEAWADNVHEWPKVDDGKLFSYILRVKAVDVDYIGKYKDQKAYSYWMSGFVDTVFVAKCPSDSRFTFLKGKVSPSQRLRDDPHKVWVCTKGGQSDCQIVTSWCTCIAGTGEVCNHVIALLYKVNYAFNKDYVSPACTSVPQGWNKGTKKEVTPSQIKNLTFRKDKKTKERLNRDPVIDQTLRKVFDPRKPEDREMTNERVSLLLSSIKEILPDACVMYSIEHGRDNGLLPPLTEKAVEFMANDSMKSKPLEETAPLFIQHAQMTSAQVKKIELETQGQSSNSLWKQQRLGRITASNFHQISTKTETILKRRGKNTKKPQYSSVVSSIVGESMDISHLPPIAWGITHEKDAIKAFLADVACHHENGLESFRQCGLFVKADYPYLAASPDGVFSCRCCGPATVEVKCPYSARNESLFEKEVIKRVEFLEDHNGQPRLKRTHKYYTQVQAQMWVCGVKHCFFIGWTEGHRPLYETIHFDEAFCSRVVNNLTLFYKTYILPCMLGYRDILLCPKCEKVILETAEINQPAEETSITCTTCGTCWHLPCAGLTQLCAESLDAWLCCSCLVDATDPTDDESDGEDEGACSSGDPPPPSCQINDVCSVCLLSEIAVGGEHICSICRKAVHAWCSNHEDITSSANLVCNFCITD